MGLNGPPLTQQTVKLPEVYGYVYKNIYTYMYVYVYVYVNREFSLVLYVLVVLNYLLEMSKSAYGDDDDFLAKTLQLSGT